MTEPIRNIQALSGETHNEAYDLLRKVSSEITPICRRHGWRVELLKEFIPRSDRLLGMNVDCSEIRLRLRYGKEFIDYEEILGTALHELAHMEIGPHNKKFHALLELLEQENAIYRVSRFSLKEQKDEDCTEVKRERMRRAAEARVRIYEGSGKAHG